MAQQWIRYCSLLVGGKGQVIDLSGLRIVFQIRHGITQTPKNALIRVYNLSDATIGRIKKEFTQVELTAGYVENKGILFQGTVIQFRVGRENPVDTYLDILAVDGDRAYNWAVVNKTLAAGSTARDQANVMIEAMKPLGVTAGYITDKLTQFKYPRSVAFFGMARNYLRTIAHSAGCTWTIEHGKVDIVPIDGTKPGNTIVLNSQTGLIGMPEETIDGIYVRALINPSFKKNGQLQINEKSINRALLSPNYTGSGSSNTPNQPLGTDGMLGQLGTSDGVYKICAIDWFGDTRGTPWYAEMICIGIKGKAGVAIDATDDKPYEGAN